MGHQSEKLQHARLCRPPDRTVHYGNFIFGQGDNAPPHSAHSLPATLCGWTGHTHLSDRPRRRAQHMNFRIHTPKTQQAECKYKLLSAPHCNVHLDMGKCIRAFGSFGRAFIKIAGRNDEVFDQSIARRTAMMSSSFLETLRGDRECMVLILVVDCRTNEVYGLFNGQPHSVAARNIVFGFRIVAAMRAPLVAATLPYAARRNGAHYHT